MPCEPPRLGRREARDLLANKTVAFVGDSVSRMMFCETAAWLFGVKGWWWQNRWVPGRATWSPSLWNNSGAIIAAQRREALFEEVLLGVRAAAAL